MAKLDLLVSSFFLIGREKSHGSTAILKTLTKSGSSPHEMSSLFFFLLHLRGLNAAVQPIGRPRNCDVARRIKHESHCVCVEKVCILSIHRERERESQSERVSDALQINCSVTPPFLLTYATPPPNLHTLYTALPSRRSTRSHHPTPSTSCHTLLTSPYLPVTFTPQTQIHLLTLCRCLTNI